MLENPAHALKCAGIGMRLSLKLKNLYQPIHDTHHSAERLLCPQQKGSDADAVDPHPAPQALLLFVGDVDG
jgi:hypothetical protein